MPQKFITNSSGSLTEVAASATSAGAADAGKIPALNASGVLDSTIVNSKTSSAGAGDSGKLPALDGSGRLDTTFMPVGIGADTVSLVASEALAAGVFINIWNSAGAFKVRNADASGGKAAMGFVLAAVASGAVGTIYLSGQNTAVTGATPGTQFLSDTVLGGFSAAAPTASGYLVQTIGVAVSDSAIEFRPAPAITLA
jgi:hypothetical protein